MLLFIMNLFFLLQCVYHLIVILTQVFFFFFSSFGSGNQEVTARETDPAVLRNVSLHRQGVHGETPEVTVRDQPHGGADAEGRHAVLRVRAGETEGPLSEHALQQAEHHPEHHILQFHTEGGVAREEDHRTRLQLLLHPRQDGAGAPQQGVPRFQGGSV